MMKCFVLVNTELGKEDATANQIRKLEKINSVSRTNGAYDMIVEVEGNDREVRETITRKIRKEENVKSTLTLVENGEIV